MSVIVQGCDYSTINEYIYRNYQIELVKVTHHKLHRSTNNALLKTALIISNISCTLHKKHGSSCTIQPKISANLSMMLSDALVSLVTDNSCCVSRKSSHLQKATKLHSYPKVTIFNFGLKQL